MKFLRGKIADITVEPLWRVKHIAAGKAQPATGKFDIVGAADEKQAMAKVRAAYSRPRASLSASAPNGSTKGERRQAAPAAGIDRHDEVAPPRRRMTRSPPLPSATARRRCASCLTSWSQPSPAGSPGGARGRVVDYCAWHRHVRKRRPGVRSCQ
jgi:hypothetical protein